MEGAFTGDREAGLCLGTQPGGGGKEDGSVHGRD